MFREFELRAPLERLEEALGEDGAAPAERVEEVLEVEAREVPLAELGALEGEAVSVAALRPGESPDAVAPPPPDPDEELELEEDAAAAAGGGERSCSSRRPGAGRGASTSTAPRRAARSPWPPGRARRCWWRRPRRSPPSRWPAATGRVVAHDWKTIAMADEACDPPPLAHDTMVAAYLIDPARRGYPLDELATENGIGARIAARTA